jgi:hypothetical protein
MASINASTSGAGGVITTADATGTLQLQSASTTVATINAFGIGLGTGVPSSGIGITFPATQSSSTDANTLDDYEQGTFTPSLTFGGGSTGITYSSRVGYYTKIGNMVHVTAYVFLSSKGSSTGGMQIINLPFTAQSGADSYSALSVYVGAASGTSGTYMAFITPTTNTTSWYFSQTGTPATFGNTQCINTSDFIVTGTYIATA